MSTRNGELEEKNEYRLGQCWSIGVEVRLATDPPELRSFQRVDTVTRLRRIFHRPRLLTQQPLDGSREDVEEDAPSDVT